MMQSFYHLVWFPFHLQVLFGLEYAHSIPQIQKVLLEPSISSKSELKSEVHFADIPSSVMFPSKNIKNLNGLQEPSNGFAHNSILNEASGTSYSIGGLTWELPEGQQMDDYLIFWIGVDNSAFANAVLTFNACEIGDYLPYIYLKLSHICADVSVIFLHAV